MPDVLETAIAAHGGWGRWQELKKLTAHVSVGGGLLQAKGRASDLADVHITLDPHRQRVGRSPFGRPGLHGVYEPERTAVVTDAGEIVEAREAPRDAFAGHNYATPWDDQHLLYFSGYTMWTYSTIPFLFNLPGFGVEEVEPSWEEDSEIWRRLKVTFPANVHGHCTEQTVYFYATGILRRHDYSVDVVSGTRSANLCPQATVLRWNRLSDAGRENGTRVSASRPSKLRKWNQANKELPL